MTTGINSFWETLSGVPYEQGYLDAGGIKTRFLRAGNTDQPALVFLHGFGGHAEAYIRNLAAHARHFNTVAIDMVGHGYSGKPDKTYDIPAYTEHLDDVLSALNIASVNLSGESLGGWVAASFAIAQPAKVNRLVLNTMGGATMDLDVLATVREKTIAAVRNPRNLTKPRLEWLMADPHAVTEELVECRTRIYEQPGMIDAVTRGLALYTEETRRRYLMTEERLANIQAETLVLWTTKDPTASPAIGERIANAIPNSKYVLMQECGHWPQWEDASTFNRIHIDFLMNGI